MNRFLSTSTVMALVLSVAVAGWMLSGMNRSADTVSAADVIGDSARGRLSAAAENSAQRPGASSERSTLRVSVVKSFSTTVTREVLVSGRTEPNRTIELRAEMEGRVVELNAERGMAIREGDQVARLDMRDRNARLAEAQALIAQHKLQYEAAQRLRDQDLLSEAQIAEARARLVASEARLADVRLEMERTRIQAPFDAIVQEREIEIGEFVRIGDTLALLVDIDPVIIVGEVSEREISNLTVGSPGWTELVDGHQAEGTIRYIAPVADEGTRTFRVELAVPNPHGKMRAGMTAELRLAAEEVTGHLLSPALLTLDDAGTIGVKTVDNFNKVLFEPIEILRSTNQGIWVTGLSNQVRIIAVGQGFVSAGELVEPIPLDVSGSFTSPVIK